MTCSKSNENSIHLASDALKNGKVVILPTDTVYGFSGIVGKTDAKIRKIKGREETKPFIVLVESPEKAESLTFQKIPSELKKYWPGPLTIIVKEKNTPQKSASEGGNISTSQKLAREGENVPPSKTIAIRCPGDKWLRDVIAKCGSPIYSTSVNRSGSPVLTKVTGIIEEFEKEVDLIVTDGDSTSSVPSTIVKLEDEGGFSVVREGAIKL